MEDLVDRLLSCCDCGNTFLFNVQEQRFYLERGFADPRRCRICRKDRRYRRNDPEGAIYRAPDAALSAPPRSWPELRSKTPVEPQARPPAELSRELTPPEQGCAPASPEQRSHTPPEQRSKTPRVVSTDQLKEWRRDRQLFEATCHCCGRVALVPFRPVQGRPVFCRGCFREPTPPHGRTQ